jgi:hypothetical protein
LVSTLSSSICTGQKDWLVDSGASKNMIGYKDILSDLETKYFAEHVELGDEKFYKIEGVGSISFILESRVYKQRSTPLFNTVLICRLRVRQ